MENFPSNSKLPRATETQPQLTPMVPTEKPEAEKRVEKPVVTGEVVRKKPTLGKRMAQTFFSGEAPKSVVHHVALQVLLPAAKEMLRDAVQEGLDRFLYPSGRGGDTRRTSTTIRNGINSVISYNRMSATSRQDRPVISNHARTTQNFDELVFPSRMEADTVIDEMLALLGKFDSVTVGDFFDLAGVTAEYTDRKFGWKDLRGVQPMRKGGGYIIDLPKPELLK